MAAADALVDMTAECGGATPPNGQQHFDMRPTDPLAVSFDEGISRGADQIGHLERRPTHLGVLRWLVFQCQRIQRIRGCVQMALREMQVNRSFF